MTKYEKVLNVLAKTAGIFTFILYLLYFVKLIIFPEGTVVVVACLLVFAGLALPLFFGAKLKKLLRKLWLPVKTVYTAALVFYMVSFIFMAVMIYAPGTADPDVSTLPEDTVFVTFGAKIKQNGAPGTPLGKRLRKTAELMTELPDSLVIVTGGKGSDEPMSEAEAMRNWLTEHGVDESRIIIEDQAKNTLENVRFAKEIVNANDLGDRKIACVSTDYHVLRIRLICGREDFGDYFYRAPCAGFWDYVSLVREYMSYGKLLLLGHL